MAKKVNAKEVQEAVGDFYLNESEKSDKESIRDLDKLIVRKTDGSSGKAVAYKITKDSVMTIDSTAKEPKLNRPTLARFLNDEKKRLYGEEHNILYFISVNGVDVRISKTNFLNVLDAYSPEENGLYSFDHSCLKIFERDESDEPKARTRIRFVIK